MHLLMHPNSAEMQKRVVLEIVWWQGQARAGYLMQAFTPDCRGVIVLVHHAAVVGPHEDDGAGLTGRHLGQV